MVVLLLFREKKEIRLAAFFAIVLAGILGVLAFSVGISDPLLPLLSGLFGVSLLIANASENAKIPPQIFARSQLRVRETFLPCSIGSLIGALMNLFPGVGPSQGTVLALAASKSKRKEVVLAAIGSVGSGSLLGSILAVAVINKARNAPLVYIEQMLPFTLQLVALLILVVIIVFSLSAVILVHLAPFFVSLIARVPYTVLSAGIILMVSALVILRGGFAGVLVFLTAIALGLFANSAGIARHHLMASILLPTAGYFLF